jgi:hypothetical protein
VFSSALDNARRDVSLDSLGPMAQELVDGMKSEDEAEVIAGCRSFSSLVNKLSEFLKKDPSLARAVSTMFQSALCVMLPAPGSGGSSSGCLLQEHMLDVANGHSSREARTAALEVLVALAGLQSGLAGLLAASPGLMPFLQKVSWKHQTVQRQGALLLNGSSFLQMTPDRNGPPASFAL